MKTEGATRRSSLWQRFREGWDAFVRDRKIVFSAEPLQKQVEHEAALRQYIGKTRRLHQRGSHQARMRRKRRARERMAKLSRRINRSQG